MRSGLHLYRGLVLLLAVAGFSFVIHSSYPGYLNGDSAHQLREVSSIWPISDWHSPSIVILWSLLNKLLPGPVGFIVFDNVLIWGSFATLAIALRKQYGGKALVIMIAPLLPGTINYLGHVHADAMLAAWLISASSFAYLSNRDASSARSRFAYQVLANIFCVAAALTRLNAIFCLIPLLLYANQGIGLRKNMVTCLIVLLAIPGIYRAQNAILGISPMHTGDSIKTFHLLGLSYYQQRNLIPGQWNEEQAKKIVQSCYSPIQWDTASAWGQCKFIRDGLVEQKIWGSSDFSRSWLSEILSQPHVFFSMLVPTFKKSMFDPNSRPMLYNSDPHWVVADNPPRATTKIATTYILSGFNDTLGRPWFFGLLSALATVLLLRLRLQASNEGRMALAVLVCGQVYLLTFFMFNVSAEFRYFYWCGFSAYTGSLLVLMGAITRRWRNQNCANADNLNLATRTSALGVASLVVTLIAFPYISETSGRAITLTALDSRPVKVLGIHDSATPYWMLEAFQGDIRRTNWDNFGSFFQSTNPGGQLVARIDMLRETVDIVLETGPELGRLAIDEPAAHLEIDSHTDSPGSQIVLLAPPEETSHTATMVRSFLNLGSALLSLLGVSLLFRKASIKTA